MSQLSIAQQLQIIFELFFFFFSTINFFLREKKNQPLPPLKSNSLPPGFMLRPFAVHCRPRTSTPSHPPCFLISRKFPPYREKTGMPKSIALFCLLFFYLRFYKLFVYAPFFEFALRWQVDKHFERVSTTEERRGEKRVEGKQERKKERERNDTFLSATFSSRRQNTTTPPFFLFKISTIFPFKICSNNSNS